MAVWTHIVIVGQEAVVAVAHIEHGVGGVLFTAALSSTLGILTYVLCPHIVEHG